LDLEGPRGHEDLNGWNIYMASHMETSTSSFVVYRIFALGPSKRHVSTITKLEDVMIIKLPLTPKYDDTNIRTQTQTYVAIPKNVSLSLYTKLEGPSFANLDFYCP
jgi:hypothetical protein